MLAAPDALRSRARTRSAALLAGALCAAPAAQEPPPYAVIGLEARYAAAGGPLQDHAAYLATLHRRHGGAIPDFRVVLPPAAAVAHRDERHPPYLVVGDRDADGPELTLTFGGGLAPMAADDPDGFADWIAASQRADARARLDGMEKLLGYVETYVRDGPALPNATRLLVEYFPHAGSAHGYRYMDTLWNRADVQQAHDDALAALAALRDHEWPLVVFCDLALRADPHDPVLADAVAHALQPLSARSPEAPRLRLAELRAVLRARPAEVTVDRVAEIEQLVIREPALLLELAEILSRAPEPSRFDYTMWNALRVANTARFDEQIVTATRFEFARAIADDELADETLAEYAGDASAYDLNSKAWELLVDPDRMGRFDRLALALMQRAEHAARRGMSDGENDTMALALYCNGRFDDAIAYAAKAIEHGDGDPRYVVRRQRYERMRDVVRARR